MNIRSRFSFVLGGILLVVVGCRVSPDETGGQAGLDGSASDVWVGGEAAMAGGKDVAGFDDLPTGGDVADLPGNGSADTAVRDASTGSEAADLPRGNGADAAVPDLQLGNDAADSMRAVDTSPAPTGSVLGEQRIAILLVSFPSIHLLSAVTPEMYRQTYFGPGLSVDSYLREISYGKVWATGQVFGPFVLDADYFNQPKAIRDAAIRAAAGTVDLTKFNRLVLVVPQSSAGLESGGLGSIGAETVSLYPSGSMTISTTWLGDASAGSDSDRLNSACHELGHNFGLEHARAADFADEPLGPPGQLPAPWDQSHDYGDSFSNMARGLGHWAAPQKVALGWLQSDTDVQTVETTGAFVIQPYEVAGGGIKVLRIRRGTGNDAWLWLEFRNASSDSVDVTIPTTASTGALIHYEDVGWKDAQVHSNLVRMNPDDARGLFFANAPLAAGASWTDPYSNLTLAIGKDVTSGLQVTTTYAQAPTDPTALTPSMAPMVAAGGNVSVSVTAAASYAWTASSSVSWMKISQGASGTGSAQITVVVSPASSTAKRWGKIVVGGASMLVIQDGLAGNVSISPTATTAPAVGATGEIDVATNAADYRWSYTVNASWIQSVAFSKLSLAGSGSLRYIVAENTDSTARTGTISIGASTFTITQAAGDTSVSQVVWQQLPLADAPMSRMALGMAGFTSGGEAILYGGNFDTTTFTDTWAWNGSAWANKNPGHNPGGRNEHSMAYDAARDQIVLFGGFHESNLTQETWIWNGVDWLQLHPTTSPGGRVNAGMVYDSMNKKVVLFGGSSDTMTWFWDGSNWTGKTIANGPAPRDGSAMAYDEARKETILFGGAQDLWSGKMPKFFGDTWVWNGSEWKQRITANSPAGRTGAKMAYDPQLGQIIMVGGFGGKDITGTAPPYSFIYDYREETWTWDGSNWTQRFPNKSPEFSYSYGADYDSHQKQFVVHLGDDLHCADRGPRSYVLKPGAGAVILDAYRVELPASGGSGTFGVTAAADWTATSDDWISLTGLMSGTSNGTVTYQVAATTTARVGRIVVKDKVFVVSQSN